MYVSAAFKYLIVYISTESVFNIVIESGISEKVETTNTADINETISILIVLFSL